MLVFASDSRTHAGVDDVNTYCKMHPFLWDGDRVVVLLSAGNLATTQAVVKELERAAQDESAESLRSFAYFNEIAEYVGQVSMAVQARHHGEGLHQSGVSLESTFIVGGQIRGAAPDLYLVYPQGNYINYSPDQPFFQIGEAKYGKPILDRIIESGISLENAARCALVSLDSTMRSNLSVGPPVDLLIYPRDCFSLDRHMRYKLNSPYFASIRKQWGEGIRKLFDDLPRFDWEKS